MDFDAVCFDIDGTLYPKKRLKTNLFSLFLRHPLLSIRYRRMRARFREIQGAVEMSEELSLLQREALVMLGREEELTKSPPADTAFLKACGKLETVYRLMVRRCLKIKPYPGIADLLARLKDAGVRVGVLTDFPEMGKLEALGISQYVDFVADSQSSGYLKPDYRCFKYLEECGKISDSRVLYVGDSMKKDYLGAKAFGWDAFLVENKGDIEKLTASVFARKEE